MPAPAAVDPTGSPPPARRRLLLVGATGLVGQAVLAAALADERVARVVAPTRRPLPAHPRLDNPVVDFARLPADAPWWRVDAVICTLGTTLREAGSRAAFQQVDRDYPAAVARLARSHGATAPRRSR
jgi:nucleoside-diphosphate-sugar epimerase